MVENVVCSQMMGGGGGGVFNLKPIEIIKLRNLMESLMFFLP